MCIRDSYVITHCAPNSIVDILGNGGYVHDHLTGFLEEVKERAKFHYWLFGHYHDNKIINDLSLIHISRASGGCGWLGARWSSP